MKKCSSPNLAPEGDVPEGDVPEGDVPDGVPRVTVGGLGFVYILVGLLLEIFKGEVVSKLGQRAGLFANAHFMHYFIHCNKLTVLSIQISG